MKSALERYIYKEVVPRYSEFDAAHKEDHALTVISHAVELMGRRDGWVADHPDSDDIWRSEIRYDILLVAAAFHDLGLVNGRERHHLDSGEIIRGDVRLREWFSEPEVETIAQAAEDHRASGKNTPRSIYGMIVAEADRVIDGQTIIRRTIQFGFKHYPGLDREAHIARAIEHLNEKYGRGGYLKLWIPWSDNAARLSAFQDLIENQTAFRSEVERLFESLVVESGEA